MPLNALAQTPGISALNATGGSPTGGASVAGQASALPALPNDSFSLSGTSAGVAGSAPANGEKPAIGNLLVSMLNAMKDAASSTFAPGQTASAPSPGVAGTAAGSAGAGAQAIPPGRQDLSQVYLQSIDQAGNINHALFDNHDGMGAQASQVNMYEQYAKEFILGGRNFDGAAQYAQAPLDLSKPGDQFAAIASVYRIEQGPTGYNNGNLKALLASAGPQGQQLAAQPNVGVSDVETLSAVTQGLNSGVINLEQILDGGKPTYITNQALYGNVIDYVKNGTFSGDVANLEAGNYAQIPDRF